MVKRGIKLLQQRRKSRLDAISRFKDQKADLTAEQRKLSRWINEAREEIKDIEDALTLLNSPFIEKVENNVERVYKHQIDCQTMQLAAA